MTKKKTRNFGDVIRAKLAADPALAAEVEEALFNASIAQQVYDLRTEANLTQAQLASLVGTKQSVISRIEDADYEGHSLKLLKRIASVLKKRLRVDFCAQPIPVSANASAEFVPQWSLRHWSKQPEEQFSASFDNVLAQSVLFTADLQAVESALVLLAQNGSTQKGTAKL